MTRPSRQIRAYYLALYRAWGPQHWWPARTRFEVIVGAYLTQNTAWTNVEKALGQLRKAHALTLAGIRRMPLEELERLIRPAGYFRQKAQRLKYFVDFLDRRYAGSLARMFAQPTARLREELLALHGIGPETADSILLYAGNHPVFVVDAYTRRILERHRLVSARAKYDEIRELAEHSLAPLTLTPAEQREAVTASMSQHDSSSAPGGAPHPPSRMSRARRTRAAQIYNDFHGLIVGVGKHYCFKSHPDCDRCPLRRYLPRAR